jgi:hypothetical protein
MLHSNDHAAGSFLVTHEIIITVLSSIIETCYGYYRTESFIALDFFLNFLFFLIHNLISGGGGGGS